MSFTTESSQLMQQSGVPNPDWFGLNRFFFFYKFAQWVRYDFLPAIMAPLLEFFKETRSEKVQ